ncbi:hypothetical protein [Methanocaldococcus jannaschii]|uniref:hypothetical protein n=1 Tax=Methanocaldococcus jannaschii TaxID=2190 RepID=UPI000AF089AD|nr:hypothetical protein [Methanocaldococcus jannaschii]
MRFLTLVVVIILLLFPVFAGCIGRVWDNDSGGGFLLILLENETSNIHLIHLM